MNTSIGWTLTLTLMLTLTGWRLAKIFWVWLVSCGKFWTLKSIVLKKLVMHFIFSQGAVVSPSFTERWQYAMIALNLGDQVNYCSKWNIYCLFYLFISSSSRRLDNIIGVTETCEINSQEIGRIYWINHFKELIL